MDFWRELQEDTHKTKTILSTLNTHFLDKSAYWIEKDVPRSKLTHHKFRKNWWRIINMPPQGFLNFYLSRNKPRLILAFFNRQFENMHHFPYRNNPYLKKGMKLLAWTSILALGATIVYREYTANVYSEKIKQSSIEGLSSITAKQVLYSDKVTEETAKLTYRICDSPRTQYQVGNMLSKVIQTHGVVNNVDKLAWKFVHNNMIYEDSTYNKLKSVLLGQLRNTERRHTLKKLFVNWAKSDGARESAINSWVGALRGSPNKSMMIEKSKKSISNMVENEQTKQNLKEKIDSYLG